MIIDGDWEDVGPGDFIEVRVTGYDEHDLFAEPLYKGADGHSGGSRWFQKSRPSGRLFVARVGVPPQKAIPGFLPIFFRISASGQNPVKADWNRFRPTKAVK